MVKAKELSFHDYTMWIALSDARTRGIPLVWFPKLLDATPEQRSRLRISPRGLHWEDLDEDISIAGLLAGNIDQTRPVPHVA